MLAVRFAEQPQPAHKTLLETVRDYLAFLDNPDNRALPYEARQELRRRHIDELREASAQADRRGSTLTEILIAVLLMSIGLVSIAALFPLSVLRTMRATQRTHATDLRYNAEAFIDIYPRIVFDPDVDGDTAEHAGERYVVDPLGALFSSTPATFGNVNRYSLGRTTEAAVDELVTCPDTETPRLYSYLLTIRKTTDFGGAVDVVVFFRRAFSAADERVYEARFTRGSQQATISYSGEKPHAKRGAFVFDADGAHWYRIARSDDDGAGTISLQLETPALDSGTNALLPSGIIDVYAIGVKTYSAP